MNNKLTSTKKKCATSLFLAVVLISGVVGITSLSTAFAEEYGYEKEKNYGYYDHYKPDMRYGISGGSPAYQTSECDDTNVNINGISQAQVQQQGQSNNLEEETVELNGQEMTPEEALNALNGNGNGEPLLNLERNIVNVCINDNDNELDAFFDPFQQQQQQQQQPPGNSVT